MGDLHPKKFPSLKTRGGVILDKHELVYIAEFSVNCIHV